MEEDMKEDEDLSANIKEYLESSAFEVCFSQHFHDEDESLQLS